MSSDVVRWLLTIPANKLKSLPNSHHHRQLNKMSDTMNTHKITTVLNDNNRKLMNKKISWPLLRRNFRDNLFQINFFQFYFFIWLVINFNVNLVFSDNNLNNFLNNNNEINPSVYYLLNVTDNIDNNSSYSKRVSSSDSGSNDNSNEYDFKINPKTSNSDRKNSDFLFNIIDDDILSEKHYTPTWAVHIPGGDLEANRVADEHGFRNLGKVSCIFSITYRLNLNGLRIESFRFGS